MTQVFYAQDESGNRRRVMQNLEELQPPASGTTLIYRLDDGTPVRRVDNDTFQVVGTGAYITVVRD